VRWAGWTRVVALLAAVGTAAGTAGAQPRRDPLLAVTARVRAGADAEALALLARLPREHRATVRARFLRAHLLDRLGRREEAREAWALPFDELPDRVAPSARLRRALALARTGRCADALPLLHEVTGAGRDAAVARALAGQCLLATGELATAVTELRAVVREDAEGVDTFAVRLSLAEALHRSGDRAGAATVLRVAQVAHPDHSEIGVVPALLAAVGGEAGFTAAQRMDRAERLSEVLRHREAVAELTALGRPSAPEELVRWLHLRGMALYRTRHDYAEAAAVLAEAARLGGRSTAALEDEFHAARALSRADRDNEAIRAYRRFARAHARHRRAGQAEYLAAWLELRHGRAAGEGRMERFLRGRAARSRPALARKATWQLAFRAFEQRRYRDAAARFERYARMGSGAMVRGRGLYWRGRALLAAGDREGAEEAFRQALALEPLHWYALLARQRLVEMGEVPGDPFGLPASPRRGPEPLPEPTLPAEVRFYAGLGLRAPALEALRRAERSIRGAAPRGREVESLVHAYRALGDASRPYRLVAVAERAELLRRPEPANRWVWEAAYPRPWRGELERAARAAGLRPEYLWAIMRQESGYDPEAVSSADAIGLLQMLPSTSERVARDLGAPFRREMLFDPVWNVRLAARYNGDLLRSLGGREPLSIGAFNAGAHRVRRWLEETGEMELDRFVERIPFDQTRNYIRRVTGHYARYLYLSDPDAGWPLHLPARVGTAE